MRLSSSLSKLLVALSPLLGLLGYLLPTFEDRHTARVAEIDAEQAQLFAETMPTSTAKSTQSLESQTAKALRLLDETKEALDEAAMTSDKALHDELTMRAKATVADVEAMKASNDKALASNAERIRLLKERRLRLQQLQDEERREDAIVFQRKKWKEKAAIGCWILAATFFVVGARRLS